MRAKKHLGQHFLTSKKALNTIVETAELKKGETVLEIGPGEGVLTHELLKIGAHVIAVETDADMIQILTERFKDEIDNKQLELIHGDALDVTVNNSYKLVANIPYYITGEILRRFLSHKHQPESMTLLVQKEVAERIACLRRGRGRQARSKKETILSLSVKCYGHPRYVQSVSARYFNPPPKVDSAIIHIDGISKAFFTDFSEERFFKVVKAGFSSKRKKLINNLSSFGSKESLESKLLTAGISKDARAEDVTLEMWATLIKHLS